MLDGISVFDDAIEATLLDSAIALTKRHGFQYGWHSNKNVVFSHWNLNFSRAGSGSKNRMDIRPELPEPILKLWESFQPQVLPKNPVLVRAYCNAYTYGCDGYVHKDSDAPEDLTAIVYINKKWNVNWAGETALFNESGEIIRAVMPKWGRIVVFPSDMNHVGRAVSRICPHLRTVLVFKARPEGEVTAEDPARDRLRKALTKIGANNTPHSGRNLLDHFLGTYDLLKQWGCESNVCLAGGLHSIYGTNVFKKITITEEHRPAVRKHFGEAAERLAWLFGSLSRPRALEDGVLVDRRSGVELIISNDDLESLRLIEAANLLEQGGSLDSWPRIRATMESFREG